MKRLVLVFALTCLVALVSQHAHIWTLPLRQANADRVGLLVNVAIVYALGLLVAALAAALVHRGVVARRADAPPLTGTLLRALPITAATLAALSLLLIARVDLVPRVQPDGPVRSATGEASDRRGVPSNINWWTTNVRAGEGEPDADDPAGVGTSSMPFSPLLLLVGALLMAAAGVIAWRRHGGRRSGDSELPDDTRQGAVHAALVDTIDAMLADPDPNTAIRGAYARLLEGLEACGAGRRDHEAPMEHLHRVFTFLRVRPEPLRRLTELFELARFSTRPLNAAHREQALQALGEVAEDLQSDSLVRAGTTGIRPLTGRA